MVEITTIDELNEVRKEIKNVLLQEVRFHNDLKLAIATEETKANLYNRLNERNNKIFALLDID